MFVHSSLVALALAPLLQQARAQQNKGLSIPPLPKDSSPIPRDLQSFSIEFAYFADYAGNHSQPNTFSKALLQNFKDITGVYPKVRVGGTTQDHSNYFSDQEENIKLCFQSLDLDQPGSVKYGPAFFEGYHNLGPIQYIYGLNMAQNSTEQLKEAAATACESIGPQLYLLELGNEWNWSPGMYRADNYTLADYAHQWNQRTEIMKEACPEHFPGMFGPSFVPDNFNESSDWSAVKLFNMDYDPHNWTRELNFHNYMGRDGHQQPPAIDLQHNLMNHTSIMEALVPHIERQKALAHLGLPYILGETNSLASQGTTGETDVFGDALWLVDFSLYAAEHKIERLHFHQGTNYRYTSWQPVDTRVASIQTRPAYYGQIMVASILGHSEDAHIVSIPLSKYDESAYAMYNGEKLSKLAVINMHEFNHTTSHRPSRNYEFQVPNAHRAKVERLTAPGSDSTSDVTFAGVSYDYEQQNGKPVVVGSRQETVQIENGVLSIEVPDSSAALLTLQ